MITRIIGLAGGLLDDEAFRASETTRDFTIDIVFSIATLRQPSFAIVKDLASNVTGKRLAFPLLELRWEVIRFLWRCSFRRLGQS